MNRRAVTYDGVTYAPGRQFRVTRRGVKLTGMTPDGPGAFRGWGQDLNPGDVVTCTGFGPGWGSDPGYGVGFTTPESLAAHAGHCEIHPMAGGMWGFRPHPLVLEPVDDPGEPLTP